MNTENHLSANNCIKKRSCTKSIIGLRDKIFKSTCEEEIIEDVKHYLSIYVFEPTLHINPITYIAVKKQYLQVLDLLHNYHYDTSILWDKMEEGEVEVEELNFIKNRPFNVQHQHALDIGCHFGYTNVVKWALERIAKGSVALTELWPNGVWFGKLQSACINGYLEIAQLMLEELQVYSRDCRVCIGSHLIEKNICLGFNNAARNNQGNVVEWLLSIRKIEYESLLINDLRINNLIAIIDILIRFRPYKLNIEFNLDRTRIISCSVNSAEEERWLSRKLPLLVNQFPDIENENMFSCLPKDVVREICSFV